MAELTQHWNILKQLILYKWENRYSVPCISRKWEHFYYSKSHCSALSAKYCLPLMYIFYIWVLHAKQIKFIFIRLVCGGSHANFSLGIFQSIYFILGCFIHWCCSFNCWFLSVNYQVAKISCLIKQVITFNSFNDLVMWFLKANSQHFK